MGRYCVKFSQNNSDPVNLWGFFVVPMFFPCYFYDLSMGFLWDSYGISMIFHWDCYGMPMESKLTSIENQ